MVGSLISLVTLGGTGYPSSLKALGADGSSAKATKSLNQAEEQTNSEGERALDLGEYDRAEKIFLSALQAGSKGDTNRAYFEIGLAESYLNRALMSDAAKAYKRAESLLKSRDASNNLRARLYDGLSWLAQGQGKMDDAMAYCEQALKIRRGDATSDRFMLSQTLIHYGLILETQGQYGKAIQAYSEAVDVTSKAFGPVSLPSAELYEKLGAAYRKVGDANKSRASFQEALKIKLSYRAEWAQYAPHPYWQNVVFRFHDGAPNSMHRFVQGSEQEIITTRGVTVAASVSTQPVESTKATEVSVFVRNDGDTPIQFLPVPPTLILTEPKFRMVPQVDPTKLAQTVAKKGERKAAWIRFWGENATTSVSSTYIGNGGMWGYPPIYSYGGAMPFVHRSGNMTTVISQVPNYAAQARALERAANVTNTSRRNAEGIMSSKLGPTVIQPKQTVSGSFFFDTNKVTDAVFCVPIGNAAFEFRFPASK